MTLNTVPKFPMQAILRGGPKGLDGMTITLDVHDTVLRLPMTMTLGQHEMVKMGMHAANIGAVTVSILYEHRGRKSLDKLQTPIFEFVEFEN